MSRMFSIDPNVSSCRGFLFCSWASSVCFKELEVWGDILALQSSGAVHLGVDNLGFVRHVG